MAELSLAVLITENGGGADIDLGARSVDDVIRGDWTMSLDKASELQYLIAIRDDAIYQVRRILGVDRSYQRTSKRGRALSVVRFTIDRAPDLEHLVGQPVPHGRMRNPVKYLDTRRLLEGDAPTERTAHGRRAVIGSFTLLVTDDGNAHVLAPAGATVSVRSATSPR